MGGSRTARHAAFPSRSSGKDIPASVPPAKRRAPGTPGSDSLTPQGHWSTHGSSQHSDQPRNPLGALSRKKKGKTKSRAALTGVMLLIGTALPPWHPGQSCRLCPAPAGVRACPAHPGQVLEEGKGLGTSSSLETEPSPASGAGSAQPRLC